MLRLAEVGTTARGNRNSPTNIEGSTTREKYFTKSISERLTRRGLKMNNDSASHHHVILRSPVVGADYYSECCMGARRRTIAMWYYKVRDKGIENSGCW